MILHPAQKKIAASLKRFITAVCGRRFGKTKYVSEEIKGTALSAPKGSKVVYIAPTYGQAHDIMWEILKQEFRGIYDKMNETKLEIVVRNIKGEQVTVMLRGWESIENLRGQEFVLVILDEVAMMKKFWVGWHEVLRPALLTTKGRAIFLGTPKGFNHLYDLFNMPSDPIRGADYESFHFTSYDNPFIPVEEIEAMKAEMTEDQFAQEVMADFRKQEGLVYKEFDRGRNVYDHEVTNVAEVLVGIDFGYRKPAAILTIKKDNDGVYWIDDEFYKTEKTDEELAEYVSAINPDKAFPDPENPQAIKKFKDKGINVREVIKNKDSVTSGIDSCRELFKARRLMVHKRCLNTISELESYHYPDKPAQGNENPEKEDDHAMDAMRYPILMDYTPVQRDFENEKRNRLLNRLKQPNSR